MAIAIQPPFWRRTLTALRGAYFGAPRRAFDLYGGESRPYDLLESALQTPEARRSVRTNADMSAVYGAVFAAIRRRTRMVTRIRIALIDAAGNEVERHPALDALRRVNESLTERQGQGLIEQHKLTYGKAYWIKRRDGLGTPIEFEIWPPDEVEVVPDKAKPWVPVAFMRHKAIGTTESVAPRDVVWFRHFIDPRNPLNGLSPIGAIRMQLDTGLEAMRFNQRYFDNSTHIGRVFTMEQAGTAEIQRMEQDLERKFKGSDKAHRALILPGGISLVEPTPTHKDMEFIEQQRWTVDEVARVFELSPESMAAGSRTFENADQGGTDDWDMIIDQVSNTCAELTEFYLWPDFDTSLRFEPRYDHIPALQGDRQKQAATDAIRLQNAVVTVNEVRDRDKLPPVPWGDLPVVSTTMAPLDTRSAEDKAQTALQIADATQPRPGDGMEGPRYVRAIEDIEESMMSGWERRLERELNAIIAHLRRADRRDLDAGDVDSYDWDWARRYGVEVRAELLDAMVAALELSGFVPTPFLSAQAYAASYAQRRAGEMLSESGRMSVTKTTRAAVRTAVADTIEKGDSLQTLAAKLRADHAFGKDRALTIARTETTTAQGRGAMAAFQSQGFEGKRWVTAGDGQVCEICAAAEDEGVIPVARMFNNGLDAPGAHVRCRCKLEPVAEIERRTVVRKRVTFSDGRTAESEEVHIGAQ